MSTMSTMTIEKVAVMGAGTMGNGIAQVFAQSGFDVYIRDIEDGFVERGFERSTGAWAGWSKKKS